MYLFILAEQSFFLLQTFTGNTDGFSVVTNVLDPPIRSQYLKVHPQTWNNQIALRAEFYGC